MMRKYENIRMRIVGKYKFMFDYTHLAVINSYEINNIN